MASAVGGRCIHRAGGDIVRLIEPATEADSAALLVQLLAAFGNVIGHAAHWEIEATPHYLNLFVVLVGFTSAGRKGTALQRVKRMLTAIDPAWAESRITPGLSSGEGLIWAVRNPLGEDLGVHDKRLMVIEPELAGALKVLQREGNTLSSMLRSAWDDGLLASLPKKQPARATGAHISVIGHIGKPELTRLLREVEMANGFANRFLFVCSRRSKTLPGGGVVDPDAQAKLENRLKDAVTFGKTAGLLTRDRDAESLWAQHYPALTADRAGLLGGITARGAAQVMRLAAIYALLDETTTITVTHLNAALAIWRYSVASVEYVFGDGLGDPVADAILAALRAEPAGLTRTDIRDLFNRHEKLGRVDAALESLQEAGLAERVEEPTAGRPVERWFAVTAAARV